MIIARDKLDVSSTLLIQYSNLYGLKLAVLLLLFPENDGRVGGRCKCCPYFVIAIKIATVNYK